MRDEVSERWLLTPCGCLNFLNCWSCWGATWARRWARRGCSRFPQARTSPRSGNGRRWQPRRGNISACNILAEWRAETSARRFPELAAVADRLGDFQELLKQWRGKILPNGELDDRASPALQRIRREIEKQRAVILSSLRNLMRSLAEGSPSQDEIVTVRGDRFVVPVRIANKSQVKGVVHGSSSSGQTIYMEPLETIELNNDLVRLREEELREIHRILQAMTTALRERVAELNTSAECIGVLDLAFACGRFAKEFDCVIPQFNSREAPARLRLVNARHPLLEALFRKKGMKVVPVSLELESAARVLVISGPNTGGKTVALKTAGLLAMMALPNSSSRISESGVVDSAR